MTTTERSRSARDERILAAVPVALVVVVPLVFLPGAFAPFHPVKWLLVCVLVPAGLAICAAFGRLRWPRWQWFVPLILVAVVATVVGVAPWMSLFGSPNRNDGLLALALGVGSFVLGASAAREPGVQRLVLRAAFVTGAVVGLLAVGERLGLDLAGLGDAGEVSRARSTWGSATFAAAHLVIVGPIAAAHMRSRDPRWRAIAIASTVAIAAGLLATGTRAAWLASLVVVALMVRPWRLTSSGGDRVQSAPVGRGSRQRLAAVVGLGLVGIAIVLAVALPQLGRASGAGRIDLWATVPSAISDRPLLGSGPDTQRSVLPAGIDESFEAEHGSEELHDRAHSLPLDALVTTGILGLVALAALLWRLGADVGRALDRQLVPTAIAAGLVGYGVTLLFAFGDPVLDPIAWMLGGLLWVAVVPDKNTPVAPSAFAPTDSRIARVVPAVAFGVLAIGGLLLAGGEVVAEHRLQRAMDLVDAGDVQGALDELDAASRVAPFRFDLHQIGSRLVTRSFTHGPEIATGTQRAALVDSTLAALDDAQRVAGEDPEVLMDRAELLTALGRFRAAAAIYDRESDLYPNSFRAELGRGVVLSELNDLDGAERAWTRAAALAPGDPRALVNLGILAERSGDPDAAARYYAAALEIAPGDAAAQAGQARIAPPEGD